jgi:membrane-bound lytic murein transglycosylase D
MPAQSLEKALGTDRDTLRALNLALLDPVWTGRRPVPRGFELRVPSGVDPGRLLAKLNQAVHDDEIQERTVTVGKADTLDRIATQYGLRARELADYNHVGIRDLHPGMVLKVPAAATFVGQKSESNLGPVASTTPGDDQTPLAQTGGRSSSPVDGPTLSLPPPVAALRPESEQTHRVHRGESLSVIARAAGTTTAALMALNDLARPELIREGMQLKLPVGGAVQAKPPAEAPHPLPSAGVLVEDHGRAESDNPADPSDYSVTNGTVQVQAAETLGHFARWTGLSPERLRAINHLKASETVQLGHRLKVEFSGTTAAAFEMHRTEFHRVMQAAYFDTHRITATERVRLAAGDSVWSLIHRRQVPEWLLRQYNPSLDFAAVRPGMEINVPVVQAVDTPTPGSAQGAAQ